MKSYIDKLLESGVALAVALGALYCLTYLRLGGILAVYSLPDEFVGIDTPDIIATLQDLVINFWAVLCIPALALLFIRRIHDKKLMFLLTLTIVLTMSVMFSVTLEGHFNPKNWILIAICVYVLSGSIMNHFAENELNREWYFVAEDYDNRVVVFQIDEQYVLMKRSGSKLNPKYEIVHCRKIGRLSYENLGKLTLQVSDTE